MSHELEEYFENQLERVNVWLSFAEAKNAAIIAFNIAVISALSEFYPTRVLVFTILIISFLTSTITSLYSFLPNTISRPQNTISNATQNNLLFWGDIAKMPNTEEYIQATVQRYFSSLNGTDFERKKIEDLASEILINSRITSKKYALFRFALVVDMVSMAFVALFLIIA